MTVRYDPNLLARLKNLDVRIRNRFTERIEIFIKDPNNLQLHNHALRDEWEGYRSIDLTNDWRAIYTEKLEGEKTVAYFVAIGTHKDLYKLAPPRGQH